jgi:hypothetical protein
LNYRQIGKITHYFDKIGVAVLQMTDDSVKVGDPIRIGEEGAELEQQVESMQVNHDQVAEAKIGDEVGLKVVSLVKPGDLVYKITE